MIRMGIVSQMKDFVKPLIVFIAAFFSLPTALAAEKAQNNDIVQETTKDAIGKTTADDDSKRIDDIVKSFAHQFNSTMATNNRYSISKFLQYYIKDGFTMQLQSYWSTDDNNDGLKDYTESELDKDKFISSIVDKIAASKSYDYKFKYNNHQVTDEGITIINAFIEEDIEAKNNKAFISKNCNFSIDIEGTYVLLKQAYCVERIDIQNND
jgi:hypothetical protein